jgi:hypothetical protein
MCLTVVMAYMGGTVQYIETIMKQRSLNSTKSEGDLRKSGTFGKTSDSLSSSALLGKSTSELHLPDIKTQTSMGSPVASKRSSKANSPKVRLYFTVTECE